MEIDKVLIMHYNNFWSSQSNG